MSFRQYGMVAALFLSACAQDGPSLSDGRVSPFAPGQRVALHEPRAPTPAALALSPTLADQALPDDPFGRAIECAVAMARLKELVNQLSEQVDPRLSPALDEAQVYFRNEARRLAGTKASSVERALATAMENPALAGPKAARRATACLRTASPTSSVSVTPETAPRP